MGTKDNIRAYFVELEKSGWTIEKGRKHIKLRSSKGTLVTCSASPSCPYALKHIQGDVKRALRKDENSLPHSTK